MHSFFVGARILSFFPSIQVCPSVRVIKYRVVQASPLLSLFFFARRSLAFLFFFFFSYDRLPPSIVSSHRSKRFRESTTISIVTGSASSIPFRLSRFSFFFSSNEGSTSCPVSNNFRWRGTELLLVGNHACKTAHPLIDQRKFLSSLSLARKRKENEGETRGVGSIRSFVGERAQPSLGGYEKCVIFYTNCTFILIF